MPKGLSTIFGVILSLVLSTLPNQIFAGARINRSFPPNSRVYR